MIIEPLRDENEWENFVSKSPNGTFYHTLKWKEILEKSFPYESLYLVIRDSNDKLIAVCPFFVTKKLWPFKILDSLPGSDFGGLLIKEAYKKEGANALKDYLKELSSDKGITYTKMRLSDPELCEYLKIKASKVYTHSGTMVLDLKEKPMDFIWNKVFTSKGRQRLFIRRFERDGFQIREAVNEADLNKFYTLYYNNITHIGGLPYPFSFFKNIWDLLYPDRFNIISAEKEEKSIGALGFFIHKEKKTIYLTYLGLDRKVNSRYRTYFYLIWEAIRFAQKNKIRYVSFGSTPSDPSSEYYLQKSKFGAEFNQDYFLYFPFNRKLFFLREIGIKVGRKMKNKLPKSLVIKMTSKL